jgi:hypothetical protein
MDALEELRLLKDQVRDVSRVCNAVATGDLTQKITVPVQGDLMVQLKVGVAVFFFRSPRPATSFFPNPGTPALIRFQSLIRIFVGARILMDWSDVVERIDIDGADAVPFLSSRHPSRDVGTKGKLGARVCFWLLSFFHAVYTSFLSNFLLYYAGFFWGVLFGGGMRIAGLDGRCAVSLLHVVCRLNKLVASHRQTWGPRLFSIPQPQSMPESNWLVLYCPMAHYLGVAVGYSIVQTEKKATLLFIPSPSYVILQIIFLVSRLPQYALANEACSTRSIFLPRDPAEKGPRRTTN